MWPVVTMLASTVLKPHVSAFPQTIKQTSSYHFPSTHHMLVSVDALTRGHFKANPQSYLPYWRETEAQRQAWTSMLKSLQLESLQDPNSFNTIKLPSQTHPPGRSRLANITRKANILCNVLVLKRHPLITLRSKPRHTVYLSNNSFCPWSWQNKKIQE